MCGIVGYLGNKDAKEIILEGLSKLEYRGYDSAGLAFYNKREAKFNIFKDTGRVKNLIESTKDEPQSSLGIGHTRWATHGKVTKNNAHPHKSLNERFIVVHNGVIENYIELKKQYLSHYTFQSETDTEVIAQLIETFSKQFDAENAILTTLKLLEGSYALLVLDTTNPDILYAAKNKSPLVIGKNDIGITVASDLLALIGYSDVYLRLEDKTFAVCKNQDVKLYNLNYEMKIPHFMNITADPSWSDKGMYEHFMLKEIHEQPSVIRRIISNYFLDQTLKINEAILNEMRSCDRIYILGAGTSMNAGFIGKQYFSKLANIPAEVHIASEFAYDMPVISKRPFFILVSQSGETADLRACLVQIKAHGYKTLTITNVETSTLANESTYFLNLYAGPEIAVASTKAYIAQVTLLLLLAYALSKSSFNLKLELSKVAVAIEEYLSNENIKEIVQKTLKTRNAFFIGRGTDYYSSLEAALKLKEISYIQTEGFAAGELKHGTIALIEEGTPVIALISDEKISKNTRSNLNEVIARGASALVISTKATSDDTDQIILPAVHKLVAPLIIIVPTQLIAYYAAYERHLDIDKPRNLAKSVTVE